MSEVVRRYLEVLEQRRLARAIVRGDLTPTEEAHFSQLLESCLREMTDDEREALP